MNIEYHSGSDPLGLCQYLLDPDKQLDATQSPIISTNMAGRTAAELAEEFRFISDLNPRVRVTMRHFSISFQPGEMISRPKMAAIFGRLYELTGHQNCLYVNTQHHDQEQKCGVEHGHGGGSAVDRNGNWVDDQYLVVKLKYGWKGNPAIERQLEAEYDLQPYIFRPQRDRHNLTTGEYRLKQRLGLEQTPTERLWEQVQAATHDQPALVLMTARLKAAGVEVRFREEHGEPMGISFAIDGQQRAGGDLGPQYTFGGLQRNELVQPYDSSQAAELRQMQNRTTQQAQEWLQQWQAQVQREHEQQARRQYYRDRYRHYAPAANLSPEQQDLEVARRALTDRQGIEETHCIVTSGDRAQILLRQQGTEAAQQYVVATTQQAKTQLAQEQAKSQKQIEL